MRIEFDKDKDLSNFANAHEKFMHRYCRKHGIEMKDIEGRISSDNSREVRYFHKGKLIITASLVYVPKVKFKCLNGQCDENIQA